MKDFNLFLFSILFLFTGIPTSNADVPEFSLQENYFKAKELFEKERFVHAKKTFIKIISYYEQTERHQNNETFILCKYYMARTSYKLKDKNASLYINGFLSDFPNHNLSKHLIFLKGKLLFERKKYKQAIFEFSQVNEAFLNNDDIIELNFKKGYSYFYKKDFTNAEICFDKIKDIQSPYFYPTNYYVAYMAYYNKDYDKALNSLKHQG